MDQDLVVRAQKGDQRAFEALVLKSHARLQAVAVGILRDPHLAEDAVQQARALVGSTDPEDAAEGTIRSDMALDFRHNTVHASDCEGAARRELALVFGDPD